MSDRRQLLGQRGEGLACDHLAVRGYQVIERNFRTRFGEIDVVARDGRCLVFCEVKTRMSSSGAFAPLASVGPHKRRQLRRMAAQWLASEERPRAGGDGIRFDAIGITLSADGQVLGLEHIENAF